MDTCGISEYGWLTTCTCIFSAAIEAVNTAYLKGYGHGLEDCVVTLDHSLASGQTAMIVPLRGVHIHVHVECKSLHKLQMICCHIHAYVPKSLLRLWCEDEQVINCKGTSPSPALKCCRMLLAPAVIGVSKPPS